MDSYRIFRELDLRQLQRLARRAHEKNAVPATGTVDVASRPAFVRNDGSEHEIPVTLRAGRLNTRIHHHFTDVLGVAAGECLLHPPPSVREHYPALRTTPSLAIALFLYHGTAHPIS